METELLWGIGFALASACVLISQATRWSVIIASTMAILFWGNDIPFVANHILVEWIVSVFILISVSLNALKIRSINVLDQLRVAFPLLYFLAGIQKINSDFLFSPYSFGALFSKIIGHRFFPPDELELGYQLASASVYSEHTILVIALLTIGIEVGIGLLLWFSKSKKWGLLLAVLFHVIMSLTSHYGVISFAFMAMVYFVIYLPDQTVEYLLKRYGSISLSYRIGLILVGGLFAFGALKTLTIDWILELAVYALALGWLVFLLRGKEKLTSLRHKFNYTAYIMATVFVMNAALPYLGGRSAVAFDMFSNLRTEPGYANHLFLPTYPLWNHQRPITILETDIPELQNVRTPIFQREGILTEMGLLLFLDRRDWVDPPFVRYEVANEIKEINRVPELSWMQKKGLVFDVIPKN